MVLLGRSECTVSCGCGWSLVRCHNDKARAVLSLRLHKKVCSGIMNDKLKEEVRRETVSRAKSSGADSFLDYSATTNGKKLIVNYEDEKIKYHSLK
jgi:hypothetical protein